MGFLFQRGEEVERGEFAEVKRVLHCLKACRPQTQVAVGAGVQLANTDFTRRFAGIESFRKVPTDEQKQFWSELSDLELELRSREIGMALGVGLYRIWLYDMLVGRRNVAELLGEELTELSRKDSAGCCDAAHPVR